MRRLTQKYGMDDARRRERKEFLGLTPDEEQSIARLKQRFAEIAPQMAEGFYRHLLAHPTTAAYLQDPERLARLKREQMQYFRELVSGPYDEEYFEKRLRVGELHHEISLRPQWYLGAYAQYLQLCVPDFARALGGEMPPEVLALLKVILLDIGLALETYFAESTEQLRRRNDELERALQMYFQTEIRAQQYAKLAGHEIRGSLNAIAHACDEVAEDFTGEIPQDALETVAAARDRCWRVIQVVEQILSEPEHAGQPAWVAARDLVDEVSGRLDLYGPGRRVELTRFSEAVPVWAQPVGLREVFANLISNAVRHLDKDPGRVAVEYQPTGDLHVFCVADNGPGIPPELQEQIFQPFFRSPASTDQGGKGLGLYFVRRIVEQHGGRVWVESVPRRGSRFCFTIPKRPLMDSVPEPPTP